MSFTANGLKTDESKTRGGINDLLKNIFQKKMF